MASQGVNLMDQGDLDKEIRYLFFLFTLVADGLKRLVDLSKNGGLFASFMIGRELVESFISSICGCTLFFVQLEKSILNNLESLLDVFCPILV